MKRALDIQVVSRGSVVRPINFTVFGTHVTLAHGDDLGAMLGYLDAHMRQGREPTPGCTTAAGRNGATSDAATSRVAERSGRFVT